MSQSQSHIKLPQFEEEIFKYWNDNQIFKYTLERTKFLRIIMIWFAFLLWTIFIYAIFGLSWSL